MVATHTALFSYPQRPISARKSDIFLTLQQPLLSLGKLGNKGFTATLDRETFQLKKHGIDTIMRTRDHPNRFYFIPL